MRVHIPTIGTLFVLATDWQFDLYEESRNNKFANQKDLDLKYFRGSAWYWSRGTPPHGDDRARLPSRITPVTLPKGTSLKVDRIYIRGKTAESREFDSVSFFCNPGARSGIRGRFWAKLGDVNRLEVEIGDPQGMLFETGR